MSEFLRVLVVVELIGLAALPITLWFFQSLPDRGYILAKTFGLLAVTYIAWIIGTVVPMAGSPWLPITVLIVLAGLSWGPGYRRTLAALASVRWIVLVEELLFVGGLLGWSLLRAYVMHPDISHTEQYMDMAFLHSSMRSVQYPPIDPWMSGNGINYYYFGYLTFGTLIKIAGVAPAIGYNLALSLVGALVLANAFSVGYALSRRVVWALAAPLFVELLGNWHAAAMIVTHGHLASDPSGNWIWESTRVIGSASDYTINEFPLFSLVLGDLHPHLMALPFTILAVAVACAIVTAARTSDPWQVILRLHAVDLEESLASVARPAIVAVILGSLFTINSWDFPTYALVVFAAVFARAYVVDASRRWWVNPLRASAAIGLSSVVLYLPFYVRFRSLAHGIGVVRTRSDVTQFLQIFGYPLLLCGVLLVTLAVLLRPVEEDQESVAEAAGAAPLSLAEKGAVDGSSILFIGGIVACCVVAVAFNLEVFLLCLALGVGALTMLQRVLNTEEPNRADAVALCLVAVAALVLAFTEVLYLKDSFDGSMMYRMNTVFKFYYQAWALLMLAGAYGAYRAWTILRAYFATGWSIALLAVLIVGSAGGLLETVNGPAASFAAGSPVNSLDGMAWMRLSHPSDYAAIQWLRTNGGDNSVVLEAESDKSGYNPDYARVSVFSGHPTVMGWPDHEGQWRPSDPDIGRRGVDVNTIYSGSSIDSARRLLREYRVRYVFVGDTERTEYGGQVGALDKFGRFMRLAFAQGTTRIYTW